LKLKEIIGWERPEDKTGVPDIDAARPDFCPFCNAPAWEKGRLQLVGHGSYERWAKIPQGIKIRIRRFLCKRCGTTCSVLPHWLLPRFHHTAPVILGSLLAYHVGKTPASVVTAAFELSAPKHGWGTLRRWGSAFLVCSVLWGWLGRGLGVRKGTPWSRDRVSTHLERFMVGFTDRKESWSQADVAHVVRQTLNGMVFDRHGTPSRRGCRGRRGAALPQKARFAVPTQGAGPTRAPP
jgi:hypothetical protein